MDNGIDREFRQGIRTVGGVGAAVGVVMMVLSRPFVLVTRVLFRKDLGERFLTFNQAIVSVVLIVLATITSAQAAYHFRYFSHPWRIHMNASLKSQLCYVVGGIWVAAFLAGCAWQFYVTLPRRGREGVMWHSRSGGVPRVAAISPALETIVILALTILAFWFELPGFAVLLMFSLTTTVMSAAKERSEFYNRVLDVIDGQIEGEVLGKAIELRLAPAQAQGLNASLPAHISDEYRKRIAQLFRPYDR